METGIDGRLPPLGTYARQIEPPGDIGSWTSVMAGLVARPARHRRRPWGRTRDELAGSRKLRDSTRRVRA